MLQEYRCEILPDVIAGWEHLVEAEQERIKKINFYFCGLHYVVGLADQAEGTLKVFDRLLYNETPIGSLAHGGYSKMLPFLNVLDITSRYIDLIGKLVCYAVYLLQEIVFVIVLHLFLFSLYFFYLFYFIF